KGGFVCIALFDRGVYEANPHYALIYDIVNHEAFVADPPSLYKLDIDSIETFWSGKALLLSLEGLEPEERLQAKSVAFYVLVMVIVLTVAIIFVMLPR